MATYRALVVLHTEESVDTALIIEYLTDVLLTMPFDGAEPASVVKVVRD